MSTEQPMSAADYRRRADQTARENAELDRLEAEEAPELLAAHQRAIAAGDPDHTRCDHPGGDCVYFRDSLVPAGAKMARCSTCKQEFPRDYIANGVCATCRPRASWTGGTR